MKSPRPTIPTIVCGSIRADEIMPLQEFCRRLQIGQKTWRSMKSAGLRSAQVGKQRFIVGRDAVEFFSRLVDQQKEV